MTRNTAMTQGVCFGVYYEGNCDLQLAYNITKDPEEHRQSVRLSVRQAAFEHVDDSR